MQGTSLCNRLLCGVVWACRAYVDNLNKQVKGKDLESMSLEQVGENGG